MLNDAKGFRRIIIACGKTDLRRGIDGLAAIVQEQFHLDPGEKDVLFLFCGTKMDRIKGLVYAGNSQTDNACSHGLCHKRYAGAGALDRE